MFDVLLVTRAPAPCWVFRQLLTYPRISFRRSKGALVSAVIASRRPVLDEGLPASLEQMSFFNRALLGHRTSS